MAIFIVALLVATSIPDGLYVKEKLIDGPARTVTYDTTYGTTFYTMMERNFFSIYNMRRSAQPLQTVTIYKVKDYEVEYTY